MTSVFFGAVLMGTVASAQASDGQTDCAAASVATIEATRASMGAFSADDRANAQVLTDFVGKVGLANQALDALEATCGLHSDHRELRAMASMYRRLAEGMRTVPPPPTLSRAEIGVYKDLLEEKTRPLEQAAVALEGRTGQTFEAGPTQQRRRTRRSRRG